LPPAAEVGRGPLDHPPQLRPGQLTGVAGQLFLVLVRAGAEGVRQTPGEAPQERRQRRGMIEDRLGHTGRQPHAVGVDPPLQLAVVPDVGVVDDGPRLVHQLVTPEDDVEEEGDVFPGEGRGRRPEGRVEAPDGPQGGGAEGHIRARAEAPDGVGEERVRGPVGAEVVDHAVEALAEPPVLLDPDLGRRLQLTGDDRPGDAGHARPGAESGDQLVQPVGVEEDVVVGEGHHLAGCQQQAPVPGPGRPGPVLPSVAHRRPGGPGSRLAENPSRPLHHRPRRARGGDVVHHDHFEAGVPERQQRVQAGGDALRPVTGGDDDADERGVREPLPAAGRAGGVTLAGEPVGAEPGDGGQAVLAEVRRDPWPERPPDEPGAVLGAQRPTGAGEVDVAQGAAVQPHQALGPVVGLGRAPFRRADGRQGPAELDLEQPDRARGRLHRTRPSPISPISAPAGSRSPKGSARRTWR
jgi:hypothetical protein